MNPETAKKILAYVHDIPRLFGSLLTMEGISLAALGVFVVVFLLLFLRHWLSRSDPWGRRTEADTLILARRFATGGMFLEAGLLYESLQKFADAAAMFSQAGAFSRAGEIYLREKMIQEAAENLEEGGQHERAAGLYQKLQNYGKAAENFAKGRAYRMAGEMYEKLKIFDKAGDAYSLAGLLRKAAEMYRQADRKEDAARMLEEAFRERMPRVSEIVPFDKMRGMKSLAIQSGQFFRDAGNSASAAKIYEEAGLYTQAGEIYARIGNQEKASQLFLKAGEQIKAADALERAGDTTESALLKAKAFLDKGQKIEAAAYYERAGDFAKAGELYQVLGEHMKSGEMYEKAGENLKAGSAYRMAGDVKRSAACLELGKDFKGAAEAYAKLGDYQKESELLTVVGEFYKVGERLRARGLNDQAIKTLQLVEKGSPDFRMASLLLGDIFQEKGMWSLAVEKYTDATGGEPLDRTNIGAYYSLAQVHEKSGDLRNALGIYEKILSLDYHFRDVAARITDVKKQVERMVTPVPPAGAPMAPDPYAQTSIGPAATPVAAVPLKKRYEILEERGRGGLAVVYKARDTVLDRIIALKILQASFQDNPEALESFHREAKSVAALNHPNIVTVFDAGQDGSDFFITMEFVEGQTLKELMTEKGKIPVKAIILITGQICRGLGYAHEKKIIHRDIKPSNIMWTQKKVVKIMDFGLAKALEESRKAATIVGGTPYYMSPEQTLGEPVDHRSDIYSLGVSLYEISSGRLPFTGGDVGYHHVHSSAPDPREYNSELPEEMASAILRCLEKDPERRYQSTKELFSDLRKLG